MYKIAISSFKYNYIYIHMFFKYTSIYSDMFSTHAQLQYIRYIIHKGYKNQLPKEPRVQQLHIALYNHYNKPMYRWYVGVFPKIGVGPQNGRFVYDGKANF